MMAPRRVIVVHEADRLLAPKRAKDDDQQELDLPRKGKRGTTPAEELEAYVEQSRADDDAGIRIGPARRQPPHRQAASQACRRRRLRHAARSPREAAIWIQKRLEKDELTIEPKALSLLLETTGLSLGRIRAEIEKLVLYAAGESGISVQHVRDLVIPQSESEGVFALIEAVRNSNAPRALREVSALIDGGVQPPMILGQLRAAAIQLRPDARLKNGLEAVFRTDVAIKSSSGTPQHLLECLVVELCAR